VCGACGSGMVRAPWEVGLAGGSPAAQRRRADVAEHLTGGRVRVRPWGPAGYLLQPRTAPARVLDSLEPLAAALHPHLRPGLPTCRSCAHAPVRREVALSAADDLQRLAVWVALVRTGTGVDVHAHRGSPVVLVAGPHADEVAAGLRPYLDTGRFVGAAPADGSGPTPRRLN
jgi:hypothetical protein